MRRYNPKQIEPKWQKIWTKSKIHQAVDFDKKPKYVMLTEFPYPSGAGLHMGHVREYTLGDVLARQKRMQGHNVLYPMGYDAFGLPTENYAIKNKIAPQKATDDNIAIFQQQLEALGYGIDWKRSFATSDPDYYKWTQWLFLRFFEKGLAYQDEIAINWCPFCKTGLADEEVVNGRHERCDTLVEKKLLKQWLLRITKYADRLLEGLKNVDYPKHIADQQINWIGRSQGAEIVWQVCDKDGHDEAITLETFTTRLDTIPGVTFIVMAPELSLLDNVTANDHRARVHSYRQLAEAMTDVKRQEDKTKTGVFSGKYAKNPFTGDQVPIYVANYVLASYGTGIVMGMPGHDERDREFALEHDLPVILTTDLPPGYKQSSDTKIWKGPGKQINTGKGYDGRPNKEAGQKIFEKLAAEGKAKERTTYRLRDWIFSRQHYWGEPIPIIHCPAHGPVAVPDKDLPVELPKVEHYEPTETGESPLSAIDDWVNVPCPICGKPAKRETDTMPNWAGSSWYYLRYFDAKNDRDFAEPKKLKYWGMVDLYLGGMEHTTLHLLYSRFWHQFLYDQKLVPTAEPYAARRGQGIILAADGTKMSKSKGNVVDPSEIIDSGYGSDALRLAIAFLAPYDQTTSWNSETLGGTFRFLQRVWVLIHEFKATKASSMGHNSELEVQITRAIQKAIKKISQDLQQLNFNTAIAALMECVNELYKIKSQHNFELAHETWQTTLENLLQLLAPFAPHIAEELWEELGHAESVHISAWPTWDEELVKEEMITIAVQINGKVRAELLLSADVSEAEAIEAVKADVKVQKSLAGQKIKKTIYVPGRLVSLVV